MALPSSGAISLNDVNVELGLSGTATISMNDSAVRTLFGVSSGAISMSDGYGKSSGPDPWTEMLIQSGFTGAGLSNESYPRNIRSQAYRWTKSTDTATSIYMLSVNVGNGGYSPLAQCPSQFPWLNPAVQTVGQHYIKVQWGGLTGHMMHYYNDQVHNVFGTSEIAGYGIFQPMTHPAYKMQFSTHARSSLSVNYQSNGGMVGVYEYILNGQYCSQYPTQNSAYLFYDHLRYNASTSVVQGWSGTFQQASPAINVGTPNNAYMLGFGTQPNNPLSQVRFQFATQGISAQPSPQLVSGTPPVHTLHDTQNSRFYLLGGTDESSYPATSYGDGAIFNYVTGSTSSFTACPVTPGGNRSRIIDDTYMYVADGPGGSPRRIAMATGTVSQMPSNSRNQSPLGAARGGAVNYGLDSGASLIS